ncbi:MAG: hypothetical protein K8U03_09660 [Planctomycetia bacterium]|nr:hypothetical protein [Planctomycetia bacterium]
MRYQVQKLGIGGILDQAIHVFKDNFVLLFSIYAVTLLPITLIVGFVQLSLGLDVQALQKLPPEEQLGILTTLFLPLLVSIPLYLLAYPLWNAATVHGIASMYVSRPTTLGECIKSGLKRWFPLVGTLFLTGLAVALGILLLVIPGLIFSFWFALAQPVAILEGTSGGTAMGRSKQLMKGNILKLFIVFLVVGVINLGVGMIGGLVTQPFVSLIVQAVLSGVTQILGAAVLVVFYFSARCEHENFDLQMLAASVDDEAPAGR